MEKTKICTKCGKEKPSTPEFYHRKRNNKSSGLRAVCKKCRLTPKKPYTGLLKCKKCQETFPDIHEFFKRRKSGRRESSMCNDCHYKFVIEYRKGWTKKTIDKMRKNKNTYIKNRYRNEPDFKIKTCYSARIRGALKKGTKSASSEVLLGCSMKQLKIHLENQFTEGMSWDNYGRPNGNFMDGWHIDHIKPCASFDLTNPEQQKECFHYTNLQPLWAKDNLSKSSKYQDV